MGCFDLTETKFTPRIFLMCLRWHRDYFWGIFFTRVIFQKNWFLLNAIKLFKIVILVLKLLRTFKFFKNLSDKSDKYVEVAVKCSDIKLTKCLSFNWLNSLCFVATETVSLLFFFTKSFLSYWSQTGFFSSMKKLLIIAVFLFFS